MSIDINELLSLPHAEKQRIANLLWEDINASKLPIKISDECKQEVTSRRQQMIDDPNCGLSHEEVWKRIRQDYGS